MPHQYEKNIIFCLISFLFLWKKKSQMRGVFQNVFNNNSFLKNWPFAVFVCPCQISINGLSFGTIDFTFQHRLQYLLSNKILYFTVGLISTFNVDRAQNSVSIIFYMPVSAILADFEYWKYLKLILETMGLN